MLRFRKLNKYIFLTQKQPVSWEVRNSIIPIHDKFTQKNKIDKINQLCLRFNNIEIENLKNASCVD